MYDFDRVIDRFGTDCVKYDAIGEECGSSDILPMWVADMDFQSPPAVREAVRQCCEHGVFGYTFRSAEGKDAFREWVRKRYGWEVCPEWLSSSPGIVTALSLAVRALTEPGDRILIMTPVYPPFFSVVRDNGRELVCSPLKQEGLRYGIDWEHLEKGLQSGVRMLILCNSHNPVGRVWQKEELQRVGELCCRYGVWIVSDEIHADLALFGNKHTVMASVSPEIAERTLTAMALLIAMSIVFSRVLSISTGFVRFNLGSLPVLLAALLFGPGAGFAVGAVADMIGGVLAGYAINPLITLGAGAIGLVAGLAWQKLPGLRTGLRLQISVLLGHFVGSMVITSLALRIFYGYPWATLAVRIPNALILAAVNTVLLRILLENRALMKMVKK